MSPQFEPYLSFDRNCAEAMTFYETTLGAKREMLMTFGQAPGCEGLAAGDKDLVMHACITLDGSRLMASDMPPGMPFEGNKGVSLVLSYESVDKARKIFEALSAGGQVTMPLGNTFWVELFGMCTDRFGVSWMINGGKLAQM